MPSPIKKVYDSVPFLMSLPAIHVMIMEIGRVNPVISAKTSF